MTEALMAGEGRRSGRDEAVPRYADPEDVFRAEYDRLLQALAGDREAAADAVQEAFVRLVDQWPVVGRYDSPPCGCPRGRQSTPAPGARDFAPRSGGRKMRAEGELRGRLRALAGLVDSDFPDFGEIPHPYEGRIWPNPFVWGTDLGVGYSLMFVRGDAWLRLVVRARGNWLNDVEWERVDSPDAPASSPVRF